MDDLVTTAVARISQAVLPVFAPLPRGEELLDAFEEVRLAITPEVERLVATLGAASAERHEPVAHTGGGS